VAALATWRIALSRLPRPILLAALTIALTATAPALAAAPVVVVDGPSSGVTGSAVSFDGEGTTDPDGDSMTYAWAIDGQALDIENPWLSVSFAHPGRHVVALTATDATGAAGRAEQPVTITGPDRSVNALRPFGTLNPKAAPKPELVVQPPKQRLRKHRLRIVLRCRHTERCTGTLRAVALKGRQQTSPVLLAQRSFSVKRGRPRVVHVRLGARARARLGRRTTVRVTAFRGKVRVASIWGTAAYVVPVAR
jgi:hypothetical protein